MSEEEFDKAHMEQIAYADIRRSVLSLGVEAAWQEYVRVRHIRGRFPNREAALRDYFLGRAV